MRLSGNFCFNQCLLLMLEYELRTVIQFSIDFENIPFMRQIIILSGGLHESPRNAE